MFVLLCSGLSWEGGHFLIWDKGLDHEMWRNWSQVRTLSQRPSSWVSLSDIMDDLPSLTGTTVPSGAHRMSPEGESPVRMERPVSGVVLDKGGMQKESLPTIQ